jgi:hypothetical protein
MTSSARTMMRRKSISTGVYRDPGLDKHSPQRPGEDGERVVVIEIFSVFLCLRVNTF